MNRIVVGLILFLFVAPSIAIAGSLTLDGKSELIASLVDGGLQLRGKYTIENKGDELAKEVFPTFKLGAWGWAGGPVELKAGVANTWDVNETVTAQQLLCPKGDLCGPITSEGIRGAFPIQILRRYRDLNGYQFSAPGLERIIVGKLDSSQLMRVRSPEVVGKFQFGRWNIFCQGSLFCWVDTRQGLVAADGSKATFSFEIMNLGDAPRNVSLGYHTSKELQVIGGNSELALTSHQSQSTEIQLKNITGLPGSNYNVVAIAEWNEGGVHNFSSVTGSIFLEVQRVDLLYLQIALAALFLPAAALYLFVFRARRQS